MKRILVLAVACCAVNAVAGEGKAAATTAETSADSSKTMSCGEMLKAKSVMPAKMSELATAGENFFEASADDLASMKSKEAKAEMASMKKQAKAHKEAAAKLKAASEDMEKAGTLAAVPNHPPMSEKTKSAMMTMMEKEKELISMLQKDVEEGEKMMKDTGAKAGGSK